jgi:hypothetical protein
VVLFSFAQERELSVETIRSVKYFAFTSFFLAWRFALYAQVEVERPGVTSPFITYEDASMMEPGTLSVAQYTSFSQSRSGKSISAPGIDFGLGLLRWLELSGFGAVAFSQDEGGRFVGALDDSYLGLKVLLWNETSHRPALAVKPMLELLGNPDGVGRAHFAIPLILDKDVRVCDLAYTMGYITRGVAYSSVKCEWGGDGKVTPVAVISASRATKHVGVLRDLGLNRTQLDGSIGVNVDITQHWSIFLEAGRTLSRPDDNSSRFEFTASIAFTGFLWGQRCSKHRKPARTHH